MGYCVRYDHGESKKKKTGKAGITAVVLILLAAVALRLLYPQSGRHLRELLIREQAVATFAEEIAGTAEADTVVAAFMEVWLAQ